MNNKPVAWMDYLEHSDVYDLNVSGRGIPLYTHSDQMDLAESIIKQQELEIKRLKTIIEAYKVRPRGKSEFAGQTHLGVYLGEK
jgi:hypothetical protein